MTPEQEARIAEIAESSLYFKLYRNRYAGLNQVIDAIRAALADPLIGRPAVLEEAATHIEKLGAELVARWSSSDDDEMIESAKAQGWGYLQCAAAIRALAKG